MKKLHLPCLHNALISVSGLFFILFACELAHAMETGTFAPPSLEGYAFIDEKLLDKDEIKDGIKETRLEKYQNGSGWKIGKYIADGKAWAWAVAPNRKDVCRYPDNYVIRDSDGDGIFDERYRYCGEDFWLPGFFSGSTPLPDAKQ